MDRIAIFDTTLRDGEQAPGFSMNVEEKLRLARQLERLQVDIIEAGFPIASEGDFEAVKKISAEIRSITIAGLARAVPLDIDRCWQALEGAAKPRIHTFLATSDIHLKYKLNKSRGEALDLAVKAVERARNLCDEVEFSAEDAGRTEINYLCTVCDAVIEAGATIVNIPDTVGYQTPAEYGLLIRTLRDRLKKADHITISTHCHDDLGLAVANSLAGIENGARQVECAINGIGERAGNAALEEIVMAIDTRKRLAVRVQLGQPRRSQPRRQKVARLGALARAWRLMTEVKPSPVAKPASTGPDGNGRPRECWGLSRRGLAA